MKKAQFGNLITGAMGISILGLVLVMGVVFNAETQDFVDTSFGADGNCTTNPNGCNQYNNATSVINEIVTGQTNFAGFVPLIVIAIVFVIIIGLLLLVVRRTGGGL